MHIMNMFHKYSYLSNYQLKGVIVSYNYLLTCQFLTREKYFQHKLKSKVKLGWEILHMSNSTYSKYNTAFKIDLSHAYAYRYAYIKR